MNLQFIYIDIIKTENLQGAHYFETSIYIIFERLIWWRNQPCNTV